MKVVKNGYTRTKMHNVYAKNFPILVKTILNGFLFILEKELISTGEPCYVSKKHLYGFYTSYSTFYYDEVNDDIVIFFNRSFNDAYDGIENPNVKIKRYKNLNDELINDLKQCVKDNRKIITLENYISRIDDFKNHGVDWNSYRCNPVSHVAVDRCKEFITAIYHHVNLNEVSLHAFPIADGGHEVNKPAADSMSIVGLELENGERHVEFEIDQFGDVSPIAFEHAYDEQTHESLGLIWPDEYTKLGEDYKIKDFENDEFLKWSINYVHYTTA